ncbi:TetR family transcriptional regulator [Catellatospora citrea]|uniref:TetR family transcriptional regulator n=1 Tax=Catellatospora citrea TaxID=53366 RepID=A0A8J3KJJ6_9ACTN|nr:TetR family transcriptional regulator [Catellatospora citrea]RKE07928.1 TetR family transcriptional regulator [Catellatospora citrea]GIG02060.1 TetR family transcriptional regulator [Catellatospora citrea]
MIESIHAHRPTEEPAPSDSTRERIVAAAKAEFSRHGIAGARVDRIAKEARTSKERVYAYFRSKEMLYAFIVGRELAVVANATRMDPADLPGYAGRLFDYFTGHPEHFRLISWGRLELAEAAPSDPDDPTQAAVFHKIDQLREAQKAGQLDPAWDPVDVLALVNQIATAWSNQPELHPIAAEQARDPNAAARRAAVVDAVQRLFPAST